MHSCTCKWTIFSNAFGESGTKLSGEPPGCTPHNEPLRSFLRAVWNAQSFCDASSLKFGGIALCCATYSVSLA